VRPCILYGAGKENRTPIIGLGSILFGNLALFFFPAKSKNPLFSGLYTVFINLIIWIFFTKLCSILSDFA
jgi:hypothetical protein